MESPERNLMVASTEGQGSPLFNFLCSLSPIKPVKSVHVAQTFSELSFPPPPAVFVTPRVDSQRDSSSLQRRQSKSKFGHVQTQSGCQASIQTENRQVIPFLGRRVRKGREKQEKDQSLDSPCSSPSKLLEQYLAEPMEAELNTVSSSRLPSVCEGKASGLSPEDVLSARDLGRCNLLAKEGTAPSLDVLYKLLEDDDEQEGSASLEEDTEVVQGSQLTESFQAIHLSSQGSKNDKEVLELDQDTSDLVFLLSEGAGKPPLPYARLADWQNQASSTLSELSIQHITGSLSSLSETMTDETREIEMDCLSTQMTTNSAASKMADTSGDQKGGDSSKVNFPVQHGFRRRCLDFEVSEGQWKSKSTTSSLKSMHSSIKTRSQSTPTCISDSSIYLTVLRERASATSGATNSDSRPTHVKTSIIRLSRRSSLKDSGCVQVNLDGQLHRTRPPFGSSPVPASMPSGIGLHLNSLTGSMSLSHSSRETDGACGSMSSSRSVNAVLGVMPPSRLQGSSTDKHGNFLSCGNYGNSLQAVSTASFRQGLVVSLVDKTKMGECEAQSEGSKGMLSATESVACVHSATVGIKQLEESVLSSGLEKKPSPLGRKRVLLPDVPRQTTFNSGQEDSSQSPQSPKKKRKSASTAENSGDGCKRCNCKKSKCLKLYCECFAAGVYCVDSCSCRDCYNKPEFEDTVLETRQQIESRNPFAFAPKIVRALAADISPTTGEKTSGDTPASARHKRGCNCKKSKCLKKYCECYQAAVGCSDCCRCENCQNMYGRKEGSEDSEKDIQADIAEKEAIEEQMDTSEFCHELMHASQQQNNDLSPNTPSFQCAGQNRSWTMSRSASKRRFSYEELQSPAFLLSSAKPPKSSSRLLRSSKEAQNSFVVPLTASNSPILTTKVLRIGQFSPGWDGLGDICTLTPLPQAPLRPTPPSASMVDGADSSPSFNEQQCNDLISPGTGFVRNDVKVARCSSPTSRRQSSHSSINSYDSQTPVDLQSTPKTPIFNAPLCGLGQKSPYEDSEVFQQKFVGSAEDDITPEFLKDPEPAGSSVCLLKTSSPKQKRVSPPHHQGSREALHRGIQSPGLRSGQKFILHSIPCVPPIRCSAVHE